MTTDICNDDGYFTKARTYGGLTYPTKMLVDAVDVAESVFRASLRFLNVRQNVEEHLVKEVIDVLDAMEFNLPECHNALAGVMRKFVRVCIHEHDCLCLGQKQRNPSLAVKQRVAAP